MRLCSYGEFVEGNRGGEWEGMDAMSPFISATSRQTPLNLPEVFGAIGNCWGACSNGKFVAGNRRRDAMNHTYLLRAAQHLGAPRRCLGL